MFVSRGGGGCLSVFSFVFYLNFYYQLFLLSPPSSIYIHWRKTELIYGKRKEIATVEVNNATNLTLRYWYRRLMRISTRAQCLSISRSWWTNLKDNLTVMSFRTVRDVQVDMCSVIFYRRQNLHLRWILLQPQLFRNIRFYFTKKLGKAIEIIHVHVL